MQKIEKWRIEELALILKELVSLLKAGSNAEWASVFSHYYFESQKILHEESLDSESLLKLVKNIKACFKEISSLRNLVLWPQDSTQDKDINQDFIALRNRLLLILEEMEKRSREYIN